VWEGIYSDSGRFVTLLSPFEMASSMSVCHGADSQALPGAQTNTALNSQRSWDAPRLWLRPLSEGDLVAPKSLVHLDSSTPEYLRCLEFVGSNNWRGRYSTWDFVTGSLLVDSKENTKYVRDAILLDVLLLVSSL
jgi:hypothetical protein